MSTPLCPLSLNTYDLAKKIRIHCLRMTSSGGSSHIGSCLSIADILAVLYGHILHVDPTQPKHPNRDRFILSKGHAGAAVYATLAECAFMPTTKLATHYQDGSDLSGHVSHKGIPGVELSTGSLGHGLGVAAGMAIAAIQSGQKHRIVALLSDGECDEGSNWEAILFSAHHQLTNLLAIVDYNKIQSLAPIHETIRLEPFIEKWEAFGWEARRCDGHDHDSLIAAFGPSRHNRPVVVIADTIKGKGVSFMEHQVLWHYRTARNEEFTAALRELEAMR